MREIKFRAWDTKQNKFVQAFQEYTGADGWDVGLYALSPDGKLTFFRDCDGGMEISINHDAVVQLYTGLKDTYYREIYEGDIIKFIDLDANHLGVVVFDGGEYHLEYKDGNKFSFGGDFSLGYTSKAERLIVGNIYENPDLLTNSK